MPIYAVKNTETGQLRLVEAKRPISAINHVVGSMFTVAEADARDGVELGRQGGAVEIAGETPADPEPEESEDDPGTGSDERDPDRLREDRDERLNIAAEQPEFDEVE